MKRFLDKLRKKQNQRRDLEDLLVTVTIDAEALPSGNTRPSDLAMPRLFGTLLTRMDEVCVVCLDLDPTVDPNVTIWESEIWLEGTEGCHPSISVFATAEDLEAASSKGCNGCYLICTGIYTTRPSFFGSQELAQIHISGNLLLRVIIYELVDTVISELEHIQDAVRVALSEGRNDYNYVDRISATIEEVEFYYPIPRPVLVQSIP